MSPEEFNEMEKNLLEIFKGAAPFISYWLNNHPEAKNYLKLSFEDDEGNHTFDMIFQKPKGRLASCPLCHGTEEEKNNPSVFEELDRIEKALKLLAERKKKQEEDVKLAYDLLDSNRKSTYDLINYLAQFLPCNAQITVPPEKK